MIVNDVVTQTQAVVVSNISSINTGSNDDSEDGAGFGLVSLLEASHLVGKKPGSLWQLATKRGWPMQPAKVEKGLGWKLPVGLVWNYGIGCQEALIPEHIKFLVDQWTLCPIVGVVSVAKYSLLNTNLSLRSEAVAAGTVAGTMENRQMPALLPAPTPAAAPANLAFGEWVSKLQSLLKCQILKSNCYCLEYGDGEMNQYTATLRLKTL